MRHPVLQWLWPALQSLTLCSPAPPPSPIHIHSEWLLSERERKREREKERKREKEWKSRLTVITLCLILVPVALLPQGSGVARSSVCVSLGQLCFVITLLSLNSRLSPELFFGALKVHFIQALCSYYKRFIAMVYYY